MNYNENFGLGAHRGAIKKTVNASHQCETPSPTKTNRNQARQRVTATERNQTQGKPRPVAYLRRYDFTLAFLA